MGDRERDALLRAASAALTAIALRWTRDPAKAEDLAQQALLQAWHEAPGQTDLKALVSRGALLMRHDLSHDRRAARKRADERWRAAAAQRQGGALQRTPEDVAAAREQKARLFEELERRLAHDAEGLALVEATAQDHQTPAEQAEALGWPIERVRNVRKRVGRAIEAVRESVGGHDVPLGWDEAAGGEDEEDDASEVGQ